MQPLPRGLIPAVDLVSALHRQRHPQVMTGAISRLANTYGSTWGKIRLANLPREIFFNQTSLEEGQEFGSLALGQQVEFEEEFDRTNGTHAIHVRVAGSAVAAAG